ncbi:MAG TPA: acyloxyacyl hydrolase [Alphaproteobacteria bacterium]
MSVGQRFGAAIAGVVACALVTGIGGAARATDGIVDEVKVGVLAHDVNIGGHHKENGVDINGEVLFGSPDFLKWIFAPRPMIGGSVNTQGNTDQAYLGLTWTILDFKQIFTASDGIYLNGSLGGAVHDGPLESSDPKKKQLGSRVLFRESVEIGYQFLPRQSISVFGDHISDAGLTKHNAGLSNLGLRYGYGF